MSEAGAALGGGGIMAATRSIADTGSLMLRDKDGALDDAVVELGSGLLLPLIPMRRAFRELSKSPIRSPLTLSFFFSFFFSILRSFTVTAPFFGLPPACRIESSKLDLPPSDEGIDDTLGVVGGTGGLLICGPGGGGGGGPGAGLTPELCVSKTGGGGGGGGGGADVACGLITGKFSNAGGGGGGGGPLLAPGGGGGIELGPLTDALAPVRLGNISALKRRSSAIPGR